MRFFGTNVAAITAGAFCATHKCCVGGGVARAAWALLFVCALFTLCILAYFMIGEALDNQRYRRIRRRNINDADFGC